MTYDSMENADNANSPFEKENFEKDNNINRNKNNLVCKQSQCKELGKEIIKMKSQDKIRDLGIISKGAERYEDEIPGSPKI